MKGRIHWSKKVKIDSKQHAWTDEIIYQVPYSGQFDHRAMQNAVSKRFPRQSSYGALHWLSGVTVTPNDSNLHGRGGTIIITETYGIAD
jgi:hypothetical protein